MSLEASFKVQEELDAKGKVAPRVQVATIQSLVDSLTYSTVRIPNTTCTVAAAIMPNGFVVALGESYAVSSSNFDPDVGVKVAIDDARAKAIDKFWFGEGYALRKSLDNLKGEFHE